MNDKPVFSHSGMYVVNNCLIVPIGAEADDNGLTLIGKEVLQHVQRTRVRRVLINVTEITFLDSFGFAILEKVAQSVALLGARSVFVGFQPGIASALVDLDIDLNNILTAVTIEDGLEMLIDQAGELDLVDDEEDDEIEDSESSDNLDQTGNTSE